MAVIDMISNSRALHKQASTLRTEKLDKACHNILMQLPSASEIFISFRKRSRTPVKIRFYNGKIIRKELPLMHVGLRVSDSIRINDDNRNYFAISFLGNMLGQFGNVTKSVLNDLHRILPNGTSITEHNKKLMEISMHIN